MVNAENTFVSATKSLIASIIGKKEKIEIKEERKEKALKDAQEKNELLQNQIETLNKCLSSNKEEIENKLLKQELRIIKQRFMYLGFREGITPELFHSIYKNFWMDMLNRYLELKSIFGDDSSDMDMLLATIYSANEDLDEAYEQLKLYTLHKSSQIYPYYLKNIKIKPTNDMSEMIEILQEKIKREPKGVVQDSYKETVEYLIERKTKLEGKSNE